MGAFTTERPNETTKYSMIAFPAESALTSFALTETVAAVMLFILFC